MKSVPTTGILGLTSIMRSKLKDIAAVNGSTEDEKCKALVALLLDHGLRTEDVAEILDVKIIEIVNWKNLWSRNIHSIFD